MHREIKHGKEHIEPRKISPLVFDFHFKDIIQVMIGAVILAIPIGFTQETWELGETLPMWSIYAIIALSLFFISSFVYYNYYRDQSMAGQLKNFFKRSVSIYVASFIVVAVLLAVIQKAPWGVDAMLAFKRTVIVALPASMSAAIADVIK